MLEHYNPAASNQSIQFTTASQSLTFEAQTPGHGLILHRYHWQSHSVSVSASIHIESRKSLAEIRIKNVHASNLNIRYKQGFQIQATQARYSEKRGRVGSRGVSHLNRFHKEQRIIFSTLL